jgi:hypothetical protein
LPISLPRTDKRRDATIATIEGEHDKIGTHLPRRALLLARLADLDPQPPRPPLDLADRHPLTKMPPPDYT